MLASIRICRRALIPMLGTTANGLVTLGVSAIRAGDPRKDDVGVRTVVVLAVVAITAAGCVTNTDGHTVAAEDGCGQHIGRIVLPPLSSPSPRPASGGPPQPLITTGALDADFIGTPPFLDRAGGMPLQGQVHDNVDQAAYYGNVAVDGLTQREFMAAGGLLLTRHVGDSRAREVLDHLPKSLPRVRVGKSNGWVNREVDWPSRRASYVVVWVTDDDQSLSLSGNRQPERLVSIARSLVCAGHA